MKLNTRHLLLNVLFSLFLFIFSILNLRSFIQSSEFGLLNLDVRGSLDDFIATQSGGLLKGDKVWGKFHSQFTNLGILSVRFFNDDRDSKDTLIFRLKEATKDTWYYTAKYETDQFLPHQFFPFGFPIIKDSENKDYVFEIESIRGATGSGIIVDKEPPVFIAKSSYTRDELMENKNLREYFLNRKLVNVFGDPELFYSLILCFLPLVLFWVYLLMEGAGYQHLTIFSLGLILFDVCWEPGNHDLFLISLLFLCSLIYKKFRFESRISVLFALGFLLFATMALCLGEGEMAEKAVTWTFLFMCTALCQTLIEINNKSKEVLSLKAFIGNFSQFQATPDFWLKKVPVFIIKIFGLIFTVIFFPLSLVLPTDRLIYWKRKTSQFITNLIVISPIIFLFLLPVKKIVSVLPKFLSFYPTEYIYRYIFTLVLPQLGLFAIFIFLIIFIRKHLKKSMLIIFLLLLVFDLISGRLTSKVIDFERQTMILSVSPNKTEEAWTDVVISGKNFRDMPFVGKLYLGGIEQVENTIYWSDEKIVFRTSPSLTKSGDLQVVPLGRSPSNNAPFIYNFEFQNE